MNKSLGKLAPRSQDTVELSQLQPVRQTAEQQEKTGFFIAETVFRHTVLDDILNVDASIEQTAFFRNDISFFILGITVNVGDPITEGTKERLEGIGLPVTSSMPMCWLGSSFE